jgi:2-phosphosulfolactate phosphatase
MAGKRLFITTTNGTRCLVRVQQAAVVMTAALINRQAVVNYLVVNQPETIWILGSGWEGSYSLEDTVCAGAIAHQLVIQGKLTLEELAGNDQVVAAIALYLQWQDRLQELLHLASHGQRLLRLNCQEDLAYCARLDTLDIVPIQKEPGVLVKQV